VGFNTNGMLLTPARADRLVALALDWLHVSLDGATAATYEGIRSGADFDRVGRNLRGLQEAKRAAGSSLPWVRVVFVAMQRNVPELPDLVALLAGWGVDELHVQGLSHDFDDTDPSGSYADIRRFASEQALWTGGDHATARAVFADAEAAAQEVGCELRLPRLEEPQPQSGGAGAAARRGCDWPWRSTYVTHGGSVQPCCMVMGSDRISLGDVNETPFGEIWEGDAYGDFRARLESDEPPDVCRGCSLYRRVF
jgi:radical SAM protein with 4Fe4S-binding SPASM domain